MSVLIEGLKMPKRMPIKAVIWPDGRVTVRLHSGKMLQCRAVPLQEKHGRLIDADALFQVMGCDTDRWMIDDISYIETDDAMSAVYMAPTIIEAEEGGDEKGEG